MARKKSPNGTCSVQEYPTDSGRWRVVFYYQDDAGVRRRTTKNGFKRQEEAVRFARKVATDVDAGTFVRPTRTLFREHVAEWLPGLRIEESTRASYDQKLRLHVLPHIGHVPLQRITSAQLAKLYRQLEDSGRVDGRGGLSKRTVRYIHTIIFAALADAVEEGKVAVNVAAKKQAKPPTLAEAEPPPMVTWTPDELRRFLDWSLRQSDRLVTAWTVLATTGVRRGELLGLRWQDIDFDGGRLSIRQQVVEDPKTGRAEIKATTKTKKSRVVDVDAVTLASLRLHRARQAQERLEAGPSWSANDLVWTKDSSRLGEDAHPGDPLHPERFSRTFQRRVAAYNRWAGEQDDPKPEPLPEIGVHRLRHTWATLALARNVPTKVVQERLGHSSIVITSNLYQHVLPTMQRDAADLVASAIFGG